MAAFLGVLPATRPALTGAFAAIAFALLMLMGGVSADKTRLDSPCEAWDEAASTALAAAIAGRSPVVEYQLGDAVFRLRRARRNCKAGWHELARLDYEALVDGRYVGIRAPLAVDHRGARH
jgi:hypothetical protein